MGEAEGTLAGVGLFVGLEPHEVDELGRQCTWRRHAAGHEVVGHNEPSTAVDFVVEGGVRAAVFTASGKQVSFREIGRAEFFGELAASDGQTRSATIVATHDFLIASMSAEAFSRTLAEFVPASQAMLVHLTAQVRALSERVVEFTALAVNNRIHAELLRLARDHATADNEAEIDNPPTHAEIASRVATHREAVTREMNFLDRAGVIERHTGKLIIRDVGRLAGMVEKVLGA